MSTVCCFSWILNGLSFPLFFFALQYCLKDQSVLMFTHSEWQKIYREYLCTEFMFDLGCSQNSLSPFFFCYHFFYTCYNVTMLVLSSKCSSTFSVSFVKIFFYLCATLKMNSFGKYEEWFLFLPVRILSIHLRQILEKYVTHTHKHTYALIFEIVLIIAGHSCVLWIWVVLMTTTHFKNLRKS